MNATVKPQKPHKRRRWLLLIGLLLLIILLAGGFFWYNATNNKPSGWQDYKPSGPIDQAKVLTIPGRPEANPNDQNSWMPINLKLANPSSVSGEWQICFQHGVTLKCHTQKLASTVTVQLRVGKDDLETFGIDSQNRQLLLAKSADTPNYKL